MITIPQNHPRGKDNECALRIFFSNSTDRRAKSSNRHPGSFFWTSGEAVCDGAIWDGLLGFQAEWVDGGLRGALEIELQPEDAGEGGIGNDLSRRTSSKAKWESDCSGESVERKASESKAGGNETSRLDAIQFHPAGMYLNELK